MTTAPDFQYLRDAALALAHRHGAAQAGARAAARDLQAAQDGLAHAQEAQRVAQGLAEQVQRQAHARLAGVVTAALAAVFDDPYEFKIDFERRRGRTEAVLYFERDNESFDPLSGTGGGCVAVAALALRVANVCRRLPPVRRFVALDEPLRDLSPEYRPKVPALLNGLCEELDMQILFTTNMPDYVTGKVIELR